MTPEAIKAYRAFNSQAQALVSGVQDGEKLTTQRVEGYAQQFKQLLLNLQVATEAVDFGVRFPEARLMATTTALQESENGKC